MFSIKALGLCLGVLGAFWGFRLLSALTGFLQKLFLALGFGVWGVGVLGSFGFWGSRLD